MVKHRADGVATEIRLIHQKGLVIAPGDKSGQEGVI
jgi:hypothetical protein